MFDVSFHTLSLSSNRLQVGDHVAIARDVLAEVAREAAGLPPSWFCILAGMRGRLIGWRDRENDSRAIVDLSQLDRRLVIFVGEHNVTKVRGHAPAVSAAPSPPAAVMRRTGRRSHRLRHR